MASVVKVVKPSLQYLRTAIRLQLASQSVKKYDETIYHNLQLPWGLHIVWGETKSFVQNILHVAR